MVTKETLTKALEWVRIFGFNIPMPKGHKIALVDAARQHLVLLERQEEMKKLESSQQEKGQAPALPEKKEV